MNSSVSSQSVETGLRFDHTSGDFLTIDNARIYFEQHGPADGAPLIFLHGGVGTIEDFNPLLPLLEPGFRVIGVDSRGHGRSTLGWEELSYATLASDLVTLTRHLALRDVTLIGFSDGGTTGLRVAAERTLSLRRLITIGATWTLSAQDPLYAILSRVTPESWSAKFPETRELYERLNAEPNFDRFIHATVRMWSDLESTGHPESRVESIAIPTLLVRGIGDHLASPTSTQALAQRIRDARVATIPAAGHEAHKDQPTAVAAVINEFLRTA